MCCFLTCDAWVWGIHFETCSVKGAKIGNRQCARSMVLLRVRSEAQTCWTRVFYLDDWVCTTGAQLHNPFVSTHKQMVNYNALKCYITQEVLISGKDSHRLVKQANMGINAIFEYNNCSRCPICMSQILVAQVAKQTIWTRTLFNVLQNLLFEIDILRNHFEIKSHGFQ